MAAKKHTKPPAKYLAKKRAEAAEAATSHRVKGISYALMRVSIPMRDIEKEAKRPDAVIPNVAVPHAAMYESDAELRRAKLAWHIFDAIVKQLKQKKMLGHGENYWETAGGNFSASITIGGNHVAAHLMIREYIAALTYITKAQISQDFFMTDDTAETFIIEKIDRKDGTVVRTKPKPPVDMNFSQ